MKIISATEEVTEVNQVLVFEHKGDKYKWVGYQSEKYSGYDLYKNDKWVSEDNWPDFLDDLDLNELWWAVYKEGKND
jgi:hypothetical protein